MGVMVSPLTGAAGNVEFLAHRAGPTGSRRAAGPVDLSCRWSTAAADGPPTAAGAG